MFSDRLREERDRIGLKQKEFGEFCGVKRNAQILYEKGERSPDSDYLTKAYELGVDVSYLITGIRTQPIDLPSDEALLLDSYRPLNAEQKKMTLRFVLGGFENLTEDKSASQKKVNQKIKGDNNQQSSGDNNQQTGNQQGVINSPNSPISNSFNQSGFTETPFIMICMVCGLAAWGLAALANFTLADNLILSSTFWVVAAVLWFITIIASIFGYYLHKQT
ncbi:helix-turn-helix domain-containing protein [Psychrobacter sp. I-STPA10]|uniref:helix-turn-helix domain-containing protein n=1 Tax=Psychrobacter sp. I-STPA10 TaxID=2585769 RepID=UPI001E303104|nr:helix-turn-helix transcriptional regulator [Psychrobacter sp. I-STPA10]